LICLNWTKKGQAEGWHIFWLCNAVTWCLFYSLSVQVPLHDTTWRQSEDLNNETAAWRINNGTCCLESRKVTKYLSSYFSSLFTTHANRKQGDDGLVGLRFSLIRQCLPLKYLCVSTFVSLLYVKTNTIGPAILYGALFANVTLPFRYM
jgi:hypothetical protein